MHFNSFNKSKVLRVHLKDRTLLKVTESGKLLHTLITTVTTHEKKHTLNLQHLQHTTYRHAL